MEHTKSGESIKAIDKTTVHRICSGQVVSIKKDHSSFVTTINYYC